MNQNTIFISSTFTDLEHHRKLVLDAISNIQHQSKAMETFGALPNAPKEECLHLVRSASAYLGIFGMRYGFIDSESDKSLTQLEYEEAQVIKLPSLIYIMDEDTHSVLPKHVDVGVSADKLIKLKSTLKKNHVVNFFSSPEELAEKVTKDITRLVDKLSKTPTAQVLSQIAANSITRHPLTEPRYNFLRAKVKHLFNHNISDSILREALELVIAGDNMAAAFTLSRGTPMPLDDAVDGLIEVDKLLVEIINNSQSKEQLQ